MFYKKEENGNWYVGIEITLPTDPVNVLTESNKVNDHGWEWLDEPPSDYLEWIDGQTIEIDVKFP